MKYKRKIRLEGIYDIKECDFGSWYTADYFSALVCMPCQECNNRDTTTPKNKIITKQNTITKPCINNVLDLVT